METTKVSSLFATRVSVALRKEAYIKHRITSTCKSESILREFALPKVRFLIPEDLERGGREGLVERCKDVFYGTLPRKLYQRSDPQFRIVTTRVCGLPYVLSFALLPHDLILPVRAPGIIDYRPL